MGHYDSYYEADAKREADERLFIEEKLTRQIKALRESIRDSKYKIAVPSRFSDSLEDFANWLK